jgi:hypothetical protein
VRIDVRPNLDVEVVRNVMPVLDKLVADDLRFVVIDKLELQGSQIGDGSEGENDD